jgi:hypothetical protein
VPATPHTGPSGAKTSAVAICITLLSAAAVVWVLRARRSEPPSLDDAGAWQWVTTSPGTNVFMHALPNEHSANQHIRVWVAFRSFRSPVSVNADVIELWEFDCLRQLSRRVSGPFRGSPPSSMARRAEETPSQPWDGDARESVPSSIVSRICAIANPNQSNAATLVRFSIATLRQSVCRRDPCRLS